MAKAVSERSTGRTTRTRKASAAKAPSESTAKKRARQEALANAVPEAVRTISAEDRERMVREAAYFIAEREGFQSGQELDYWLKAEIQVEEMLAARAEGQH